MDKRTILEVKRYMSFSDDMLYQEAIKNNDVFYFCAVFNRIDDRFEDIIRHKNPVVDQKILLQIHEYVDPEMWMRLARGNSSFDRYIFGASTFDVMDARPHKHIEHILKLWVQWGIRFDISALSAHMITSVSTSFGFCYLYSQLNPTQKTTWFNGLIQNKRSMLELIQSLNFDDRENLQNVNFIQSYFDYLKSSDFQQRAIEQRIPHYCIGGPMPHDIEHWNTAQKKRLSKTLKHYMQRYLYSYFSSEFESYADCKATFTWLKKQNMMDVIEYYNANILLRLGSKNYKDDTWYYAIKMGFFNTLVLKQTVNQAIQSVIDCDKLALEDVPSLRNFLQKKEVSDEIDLHF